MRAVISIFLILLMVPILMGAYPQPAPSDGYIPGSLIATGTTQDATVIKAGPGVLGFITATNINAAQMYIKVYDKATAPTSSDTPKFRILVPGSTTGSGTNVLLPLYGARFSSGISFRIVTTYPDNGNTGVTAGDILVNYGYK